MSTMKVITMTTLQILNDRVFPYAAKKFEEWNDFPRKVGGLFVSEYAGPIKEKKIHACQ